MSQFIVLDQAEFQQPEMVNDEFFAITNVIRSIQLLENDISILKSIYQKEQSIIGVPQQQ